MGRKKADWPLIKRRVYPTGTVAWIVDCGMINGKRPRYAYVTKVEAETKAQQLRIERENDGNRIFSLSAREQLEASRALKILAPLKVSLTAAAEFYRAQAAVVLSERQRSRSRKNSSRPKPKTAFRSGTRKTSACNLRRALLQTNGSSRSRSTRLRPLNLKPGSGSCRFLR